jgi:hypothetical protein
MDLRMRAVDPEFTCEIVFRPFRNKAPFKMFANSILVHVGYGMSLIIPKSSLYLHPGAHGAHSMPLRRGSS